MNSVISERLCKIFLDFHKKFPSGGFLHIVTDDGNWETEHIVWSLMHWKDFCDNKEEVDWLDDHEKEIIEMCTYFLELKEKQRYKIWGDVQKFNGILKEREENTHEK